MINKIFYLIFFKDLKGVHILHSFMVI